MFEIEGGLEIITTNYLSAPKSLEIELYNAKKIIGLSDNCPENVKKIIQYCVENKIGYLLSKNQYAGTCRDARSKRYRLGHVGIPLYDELKSIVGMTVDKSGSQIFIAMHCRGHMEIDFKAVQSLLGIKNEIQILSDELLAQKYGLEFGIVNPISLCINSSGSLLQIFDDGLLTPISRYPGTMMTNAGNHYFGLEFDIAQVIESIPKHKVDSIAIQDRELLTHDLPNCTNPKSIGIITGNGPDSGMALWRGINDNIADILGEHFLGDMSLPKVYIASIPAMGLSMELDKRESATQSVLLEAVESLKLQKVNLLALACHTTHYFEKQIREIFDSDTQHFISMPETVIKYLQKENISDAAILGINYVADLGMWSAYSPAKKLNIRFETLSDDVMEKFHEIGYDVKQMGDYHKSFMKLISLIRKDVKSSNVIIALTELSILLENSNKKTRQSEKNIIDALDLYAKEIADACLGLNK